MEFTWRRIITGSLGTFAVVLGFLAGRMTGGGDPGLPQSATAHAKVVKSTPGTSAGASSGDDDSTSTYDDGSTSYDDGSTGSSPSSSDLSPPVTASS